MLYWVTRKNPTESGRAQAPPDLTKTMRENSSGPYRWSPELKHSVFLSQGFLSVSLLIFGALSQDREGPQVRPALFSFRTPPTLNTGKSTNRKAEMSPAFILPSFPPYTSRFGNQHKSAAAKELCLRTYSQVE